MDDPKVPPLSAVGQLAEALDSPEIAFLVSELETTRWTGRPGYPLRSMAGMALAKSIYAIPTWTRTVALVREHTPLAAVIAPDGNVPSVYACYRFTTKFRAYEYMLAGCIDRVTAGLSAQHPEYGRNIAIDGSDMPAYANGQGSSATVARSASGSPTRTRPGAPLSRLTRKGGGYYGFKLHAAVCTATGLPVAWTVETASAAEPHTVIPLIDTIKTRGFAVETAAMDRGYDVRHVYDGCEDHDVRPIIPLKQTPGVKQGWYKPPTCEHGEWRFAGADYSRKATKWRCPTSECAPASQWVKAERLFPLIPRDTPRWRKLYNGRGAVEREFDRLKNDWALSPLRVRGLDRVRLHADPTILAKFACALTRARDVPLAAQVRVGPPLRRTRWTGEEGRPRYPAGHAKRNLTRRAASCCPVPVVSSGHPLSLGTLDRRRGEGAIR